MGRGRWLSIPRVIAVAAALGVDEKSKDGMDAQGLEEIRRVAGSKAASCAFRPLGLPRDMREDLEFLFFRGGGEAGNAGKELGGGFLHGVEAFLIDGQGIAEESFQRAVNEVDHAGFARAGRIGGGDHARSKGFDLAGLVGGEKLQARNDPTLRLDGRARRRKRRRANLR